MISIFVAVGLTDVHANLLVRAVEPIRLSGRHAKVRRDGYRKAPVVP